MNQRSRLTRARAREIAMLERAAVRRESGQFRIEGWRAVESAIRAGAPLREIFVAANADEQVLKGLESGSGLNVLRVSQKVSSRLSTVVNDQGIVAVADTPVAGAWESSTRPVIALDGVQDPGNVGTIVRTAAWFGFSAVVAGPGTADFFNPKTVRSMAGSMWDLGLVPSGDLTADLTRAKSTGWQIVGAELDGDDPSDIGHEGRIVLVMGSEAHGVSGPIASLLDRSVSIARGSVLGATSGVDGVESLNVAVAAGILMSRLA